MTLQKVDYPIWVKTDNDRVKYLLLRTALELNGEPNLAGLARASAISTAIFAKCIENGSIKPHIGMALELLLDNKITRFDYCPYLLQDEICTESYQQKYGH